MVGEHVVVYNARDGALHRAVPVTRTVKIVDTSPPSITLYPASAGWCEVDATTAKQGGTRGASGAGRDSYDRGGYDWRHHNGFDVAGFRSGSVDLTDRTAPSLSPSSTATEADLVPWATKGDTSAVSGSGVSASPLLTPQIALLRAGGMQRVLTGLTPGHAYHVKWSHKFPQDSTCDASLVADQAYLSHLMLKATVDNLVLWSRNITEKASTESYKMKAPWVAGDELHFIAGWEHATITFEATPLLNDGCAAAVGEVFVEAKGPFQEKDLLSIASGRSLVDAAGLASMATQKTACGTIGTAVSLAKGVGCTDLAAAIGQCAASTGHALQPASAKTLVSAAEPAACGACAGSSFGNRVTCSSLRAPPAVIKSVCHPACHVCTLTMDVSSNTSGVRDPGADAYDVVDGAVEVESDWREVCPAESVATRTVFLVDQTPPVLELDGNFTAANPFVVESGPVYRDPGVLAVDAVDGNITSGVAADGVDNINRMLGADAYGDVAVVFRVSDASGNTATATRHVRVVGTHAWNGGAAHGEDGKGGRQGGSSTEKSGGSDSTVTAVVVVLVVLVLVCVTVVTARTLHARKEKAASAGAAGSRAGRRSTKSSTVANALFKAPSIREQDNDRDDSEDSDDNDTYGDVGGTHEPRGPAAEELHLAPTALMNAGAEIGGPLRATDDDFYGKMGDADAALAGFDASPPAAALQNGTHKYLHT